MATDAFTTWLERGRAHQREGRAADAIPCFRRASREAPASPVPHFHLGEVWWQLGRPAAALQAWRRSAELDPGFLPPRLALAEVGLHEGEFALARDAAAQAMAVAAADVRARMTHAVASAALGERSALASLPALVAEHATLAQAPPIARALAQALDRASPAGAKPLVDALAPVVHTLPPALVAALVRHGAGVPDQFATRAFTLDDRRALREIAVALGVTRGEFVARLADAYCALTTALPRPPVPLIWPRRTRGRALRLAWVLPAPAGAAWAGARTALRETMAALQDIPVALVVLCCGDPDLTRDALAGVPMPHAVFAGVAEPADNAAAKAIAARDCDVLVDGVGLAQDVATMLLARPARHVWSVAIGMPAHRAPIVQEAFEPAALAKALRALHAATDTTPASPSTADELAQAWDHAVALHREGDLSAAAAAYAAIVAEQPEFAPALHLAGVVAATQEDPAQAATAFARALDAQPGFIDARLAAADLALAERRYDDAMRLVDAGLRLAPFESALLRMQARVHARRGDTASALAIHDAILLRTPADALAHFDHGTTLQRAGDVSGAARAYQRALTFDPGLVDADFNLGVVFAQQGNRRAATAAFRHVLAVDRRHVAAYKHLGDALLADGEIDAWLANFHEFERHCPDALPLAVYALEACQHAGDFERLDRTIDGLRRDAYRARDAQELAECLESLLHLLLYFDVEGALLLRLAQAYDSAVRRVYGEPIAAPAPPRRPGRLRIGYIAGDLRNHVMGKMMWQAIEHHDREQFDLYFYSTTTERDAWTERFVAAATRFVSLADRDDFAAANEIARDELDLLVDLSTHTQGSRPGILARKPAPVALTHIASAGTLGMTAVDYKLTDGLADVADNQEFMLERLLPMAGCVYPYRHIAPAPTLPFTRATLGLDSDAFVIGAFVNPLKLSRRGLTLWRDVLDRIPRARLAFSPAHPAQRASYLRLLDAIGIDRTRAVFLPQGRDDAENQARYRLIDVVLDTMPYGGVNVTLEALDMNVPVVTLVGRRHGERSTYSILAHLGVLETVAQTGREYVDLAVRLATDATFAAAVRAAIARGLAGSPLTDMPAHTRHLEAAYRAAIAREPTAMP
ncbi:MAG: tetratricopeptide repeat protein [Burkholderiales bacterium]|nr:tetratricopeptide repeat protein [Burkholderiales bacterium]